MYILYIYDTIIYDVKYVSSFANLISRTTLALTGLLMAQPIPDVFK